MKEKVWKDCPICGAKDSMSLKKRIYDQYQFPDYEPVRIGPLEGSYCKKCGDGFYTIASNRYLESQIAHEKAMQDAERTVAADLVSPATLAEHLHISRQRVYKMMEEGKIPYAYIEENRFAVRPNILEIQKKIKRGRHLLKDSTRKRGIYDFKKESVKSAIKKKRRLGVRKTARKAK